MRARYALFLAASRGEPPSFTAVTLATFLPRKLASGTVAAFSLPCSRYGTSRTVITTGAVSLRSVLPGRARFALRRPFLLCRNLTSSALLAGHGICVVGIVAGRTLCTRCDSAERILARLTRIALRRPCFLGMFSSIARRALGIWRFAVFSGGKFTSGAVLARAESPFGILTGGATGAALVAGPASGTRAIVATSVSDACAMRSRSTFIFRFVAAGRVITNRSTPAGTRAVAAVVSP
eukprot:COSAG01_NODE_2304_length_7949_cov_5.517962_3_plen_237_part_00